MTDAVRGFVFLLNGNSFSHFDFELVVINGFTIKFDGQLLLCRCVKQSRNIIRDAHQVDDRGTLVLEDHNRLDFLCTIGTQTTCGVRLRNICFQDLKFLFLKFHRTLCALNGSR